jgi:Holliday junction resolvasome RuvABC endonuclease subunit
MTTTTTIVAFDLGLQTTGVCWEHHRHDHFILPARFRTSPMTDLKRQARLTWWRSTFAAILLPHPRATVWVEAPFLSRSHPSGSVELLKLHGVLAAVCAENGIDRHELENRTLKKWAVGNGNAAKHDMVAEACRLGWDVDDHNEADAIHLWRYATALEAVA